MSEDYDETGGAEEVVEIDEAVQQLKVTVSDFLRFLGSFEKKITCEVCESTDWVYHSEKGDSGSSSQEEQNQDQDANGVEDEYIIPFEMELAERSNYLPVAIYHCKGCGNLKQINYIFLRRWVDENPVVVEPLTDK